MYQLLLQNYTEFSNTKGTVNTGFSEESKITQSVKIRGLFFFNLRCEIKTKEESI